MSVSNNGFIPSLLALAVEHQGALATLDQRIDPKIVRGGSKSYFMVPRGCVVDEGEIGQELVEFTGAEAQHDHEPVTLCRCPAD